MADEPDDLLNPSEIEALLNATSGLGAPGGSTPPVPRSPTLSGGQSAPLPGPGGAHGLLGSNDIESLLQQRVASQPGPRTGRTSTEELLDRADADLAAAIAPEMHGSRATANRLAGAKPFEFEQFGPAGDGDEHAALNALQEVELDLRIELGRTELLIEEVLKLREGSVVPLDKLAGDPVDILVNGRLIARGEVLVLNDNFCVRVAEILTPSFP